MRIYAYLRASTKEQDASRAKEVLGQFALEKGRAISAWFIEHVSGASLKRPELFKLLEIAQKGDVLLVEQVDRISRLNTEDWQSLKQIIKQKGIRIVALDLPTSHQLMQVGDHFTQRMLAAVNDMLLDMLAAVARKEYEDRRRRQAEGIRKAKEAGKYSGRPMNKVLRDHIASLLLAGKSYREIAELLGCSRSTISDVKKKRGFVLAVAPEEIPETPYPKAKFKPADTVRMKKTGKEYTIEYVYGTGDRKYPYDYKCYRLRKNYPEEKFEFVAPAPS